MLLLDILLVLMISVCIVYCWILNRRIHDLQNSRIEFARMVKELNVSIVKAANSVQELDELSKNTSNQLKSCIDDANKTLQELLIITEVSNDLANKLEQQMVSLKADFVQTSVRSNVSVVAAKTGDSRFTSDDLVNDFGDAIESARGREDATNSSSYGGQLKKFLDGVAKHAENKVSLNQSNYYDSLRKVTKG